MTVTDTTDLYAALSGKMMSCIGDRWCIPLEVNELDDETFCAFLEKMPHIAKYLSSVYDLPDNQVSYVAFPES